VWFVDLVPITDPGRVGAAVAAAVRLSPMTSKWPS
jgi:predicted ATPase